MPNYVEEALVNLEWPEFKAMVQERKLQIQRVTLPDRYLLVAADGYFKVGCVVLRNEPIPNANQSDYEANSYSISNRMVEERGSIKLIRGSGEATTETNGIATVLIKSPGTPGSSEGRFIEGGTCWFASGDIGDWAEVHLVDHDNILGGGAGALVATYTDIEAPNDNQGWWIKKEELMVINNITKKGWIPAGLYLKV